MQPFTELEISIQVGTQLRNKFTGVLNKSIYYTNRFSDAVKIIDLTY